MKLILFLLILPVFAETAKVTVAHQPLEVFKAAFGGSLKGVGMYKATVCNMTDTGLKLSEGVIVQAVEKRVGTIDPLLAMATAQRSKKQGKIYKIAKGVEWASFTASVLMAGGTIAASEGLKVGVLALNGVSNRLSDSAASEQGLDFTQLNQFLDPQKTIVLEGRACTSKLTLGSFRKVFDPFEVLIP